MSTLHFLFFKTGPRQVRNLREAASYLCKQPRCNIDLRDNEGETPLLVACLRKECVLRKYICYFSALWVQPTFEESGTKYNLRQSIRCL